LKFNSLILLVPKFIKHYILKIAKKIVNDYEQLHKEKIPSINIEIQHLKNTILLPNREELLKKMSSKSIIAEVGVDEGDFSQKIINIIKPSKLYLIDLWDSERYNNDKYKKVISRFNNLIECGQIEFRRGDSANELNKFPDNFFDMVYIDTVHDYKTTYSELLICKEKVKKEGLIAGHDYNIGNWRKRFKYGVIEAVHEFMVKYNYELIYLTNETHQH